MTLVSIIVSQNTSGLSTNYRLKKSSIYSTFQIEFKFIILQKRAKGDSMITIYIYNEPRRLKGNLIYLKILIFVYETLNLYSRQPIKQLPLNIIGNNTILCLHYVSLIVGMIYLNTHCHLFPIIRYTSVTVFIIQLILIAFLFNLHVYSQIKEDAALHKEFEKITNNTNRLQYRGKSDRIALYNLR